MKKKLAETLSAFVGRAWIKSVLNEAPQVRRGTIPPVPPPGAAAAPPADELPPEEAPPEEAPADQQPPPADAPPDQAPPDQAPPADVAAPPAAPPEPPVGGNQADPSEQPPADAKPFQNDGRDDLNPDGTPKPSPSRYRQPGPGDQKSIERFLKANPKATDGDMHSFLRSLGVDPAEGEKVVMKLARKTDESIGRAFTANTKSIIEMMLGEAKKEESGLSVADAGNALWAARQHEIVTGRNAAIAKPTADEAKRGVKPAAHGVAQAAVRAVDDAEHKLLDAARADLVSRGQSTERHEVGLHAAKHLPTPDNGDKVMHQTLLRGLVDPNEDHSRPEILAALQAAHDHHGYGQKLTLRRHPRGDARGLVTYEPPTHHSEAVQAAAPVVKLFLGERKDLIPGGKGDKTSKKDVDPEQLRMGIKVELEHTRSEAIAKEIALDHLKENPRYYTMLKKIHKESTDIPWRDQTFGGSYGNEAPRFWNIGKVHDYAVESHPVQSIPVKSLAHLLKPGSGLKAGEPLGSGAFKARAARAVMHPILLVKHPKHGLDLIDGSHRLHKAIANGDTHIQARVIPYGQLPDEALTSEPTTESVYAGGIITDDAPEPDLVVDEFPLDWFAAETHDTPTPEMHDPRTGSKEVSCSIVIPLPTDLARQFPRMIGPNDCSSVVPHVTVLHVGSLSPSDYKTMIDMVQTVVANYQPFFMDMHGADVFDNDKDYDVLYANATSRTLRAYDKGIFPTLNVLHADLRKALEAAEIEVKHDYGKNKGVKNAYAERYMPHATIAYIPKGEQCLVRPPTGSWFALDVECWGWEKIQLQLGKTVMDQPAFRR